MGTSPLPDYIDFNGSKLFVTRHALERFTERFAKIDSVAASAMKNPLKTIQKMLKGSQKMDLDPRARLMRLLNNHGCLAEYWIHLGTKLRFVIIYDPRNEDLALVTVEQAYELVLEPLKPFRDVPVK